ncbi:MAG: 50S ribosome-binding GTPase [Myxococcales bacterium]|nr:50S ribosome-binding GTPase [Myxococcales bacterium]
MLLRREQPTVSLVGYTNAGKSTLLNTITGASVLAEDKLFATLDTRARRLRLPQGNEIVLTDTVGFIRNMPKDLFAAFRATFEEAADADLLLEVVDSSDAEHQTHIDTTQKLLEELELDQIPRLLVYNKLDRLSPDEVAAVKNEPDAVGLSALDKSTTHVLLERIAALLDQAEHDRENRALAAQMPEAWERELIAAEEAAQQSSEGDDWHPLA